MHKIEPPASRAVFLCRFPTAPPTKAPKTLKTPITATVMPPARYTGTSMREKATPTVKASRLVANDKAAIAPGVSPVL